MSKSPSVCVVLSTYNGEKYIECQMDSILGQNYSDFHVLVRDDGSSDSTVSLLHGYEQGSRGKVRILTDSRGNLGSLRSFELLLSMADTEYVAFADQDDKWEPDKLSKLVSAIEAALEGHAGLPALAYSDLAVVDSELKPIYDSFYQYTRINKDRGMHTRQLLVQNGVVGCSVLVNRRLRDIALPFPPECLMHDWWLALCASYSGCVAMVDEALVRYRQHADNAIGAVSSFSAAFSRRRARKSTFASIKQGMQLLTRGLPCAHPEEKSLLERLVGKRGRGLKAELLCSGVRKSTILRTIYFYLFECEGNDFI